MHEWWLGYAKIFHKVIRRFLRRRKHFEQKILYIQHKRHFKHFSGRAAVKISTLSKEENLCTNLKIPLNATLLLLLLLSSR